MPRFWRHGLLAASIIMYAVVCIVILALANTSLSSPAGLAISDLVEVPAASFSHRSSGEFTRDGRVVTAPLAMVTIPHTLAIMRHQVSAAEYRRCVEAGACPTLDDDDFAVANRPVVISQLARRPGLCCLAVARDRRARLPTDEE
jgi:formylglycine-generating enzyme required for sulfatase activity